MVLYLPGTSSQERLNFLREHDPCRAWGSLHDRRVCVRCTRVFDGHELLIVENEGDGGPRLHCPTPDCDSLPVHWLFCGRPVNRRR